MNITVTAHIDGVVDFDESQKDYFENDLYDRLQSLLVYQGVDHKDLEMGFDYADSFEHEDD